MHHWLLACESWPSQTRSSSALPRSRYVYCGYRAGADCAQGELARAYNQTPGTGAFIAPAHGKRQGELFKGFPFGKSTSVTLAGSFGDGMSISKPALAGRPLACRSDRCTLRMVIGITLRPTRRMLIGESRSPTFAHPEMRVGPQSSTKPTKSVNDDTLRTRRLRSPRAGVSL